ncbi:MAG: class I SAM-dependent methyltransferase [Candidatus Levybacteria bacterium]|nr:class I SAM-dependent methyltransferase [Candidatus Levybacteria bacterium]
MKQELIEKISKCRVCKKNDFSKVLSFGPTPLANAFITREKVNREEYFYPLDVYFCNNCKFLTLGHVVSPVVLFKDYVYVSSTSPIFVNHFKVFADDIHRRFILNKESLIIDIGSNDGILLKPFKVLGSKVLGIEPAQKIAKVAQKDGIETLAEFFNVALSKKIVGKFGKAKVITATNVFAHIDDLDEVINGLDILLEGDGVFIMEAPYLVDFLEKRYFDLVYHEHLSYWSINSLKVLFRRFNMQVFDVKKVPVHGGTIRVFVKKKFGKYRLEKNVEQFLKLEEKWGLDKKQTYLDFADKVLENKVKLLELLRELKSKGKSIAGYGAPAKGNTLLNYFSIGLDFLEYIVDDSPWKQGLYSPGKRIPVVESSEIYKNRVDFLLILAWNFADPIIKKHDKFKESGGKFIVPVPTPKVI